MHYIKSIRGKRTGIPRSLESIAQTIKKATAANHAQAEAELALRESLIPVWNKLRQTKDVNELLVVADFLTETGSFTGRFFYEEAYRLK